MNNWLAQMFGGQAMAGGPGGFGTMASNPEMGGQAMGGMRAGGMEGGGGFWQGGMDSPLTMGLLGTGLGMLHASQPKPGGVSFGEALGGGAGGLLGGLMTSKMLGRGAGLLGGETPSQTGQPPTAGSPSDPAAQGAQTALMPPISSDPASSQAIAGAPRISAAPFAASQGGDPYGGGRRISVGAPASQRPMLPPQYGRRRMSPFGMAYGGV